MDLEQDKLFEEHSETPPDGTEVRNEDETWPPLLRNIPGIPEVLRVLGDTSVLSMPCISIIGSRRPTPYGIATAELAARVATECGLVVVSGGAVGCDQAASRAALASGGKTVLIPGCGADVVYPPSSRDLFQRARAGEGAIVSMEKWGMKPRKYLFPKRNLLIAAMSRALVITEAGFPSGTFSTAEAAGQLSRPLFCIPGSIFSPNSHGSNRLIEDGAFIIPDAASLESAIAMEYGVLRAPFTEETIDRGRVLSALVANPARPAELAELLGENVLTILRTLTDYEAQQLVCKLPDGRYSPSEKAFLVHNKREGILPPLKSKTRDGEVKPHEQPQRDDSGGGTGGERVRSPTGA